jgi:hypothetical protein
VCCWIDWLLMIKNCLIESGPPCIVQCFATQTLVNFFSYNACVCDKIIYCSDDESLSLKNKLHGLSPRAKLPTKRPPLISEVSANFVDRRCHVVSVTDPYGRILDFHRFFFNSTEYEFGLVNLRCLLHRCF